MKFLVEGLSYKSIQRYLHSGGRLAGMLLVMFILTQCAGSKQIDRARVLSYPIADKTLRGDVLTQSAIVLSGYNFTIEYANVEALRAALVTNWRMLSETIPTEEGEELLEYRDRATINFSVRGYQGKRVPLVYSTIQFEMQMRTTQSGKWSPVTPGPQFNDQYTAIVYQIKNRLRRLGYRFN